LMSLCRPTTTAGLIMIAFNLLNTLQQLWREVIYELQKKQYDLKS
jgi:hypothetical protein